MDATETETTWHALPTDEVLTELNTSEDGLSTSAAAERLEEDGPNVLSFTDQDPAWKVLLSQFTSPLILILIVAAAVTTALQHWADAIAIMVVVLLNATVGFWQEMKAAADVRALASLTVAECRVRRDGDVITISSEDVVRGDVVLLESGDRVAADLRIIDARELKVDESMLTGESMPASKQVEPVTEDAILGDQLGVAFSGTLVTSGRGRGVVIATGEDSQLGRINELVQGPRGETPLERLIHRLEKRIGIAVGIIATFVFVTGMVTGAGFDQAFLSAVALAVAAIPEALPVVLTIAMALGVRYMAKVNAVVRTLPSVETLGSTSTIGSDKTGTLTRNLLTVGQIWTSGGVVNLEEDGPDAEHDQVVQDTLEAGALTNEARPDDEAEAGFVGDAVDVAMASAAVTYAGFDPARVSEEPTLNAAYESDLRYSQSLRHMPDGSVVLFVKGAPDALLDMSESMLTADGTVDLDTEAVQQANDELGAQGLRVLATARRVFTADEAPQESLSTPAKLTFLGLQGMSDPPREGVAQAIADCRTAGIDVIMITGDHPATAAAIASQLGLNGDKPLTGKEISSLEDDALLTRLGETGVAARVTPQDKLRIVELLRSNGDTIAVTGDGVNDAPALKAASIGVAMGASGTEVAREAADIVLTDDNFVTIVRAVEQGRITFAAIQKATFFLLSTALAVLIAVALNAVMGMPLIFLPIQVLWINVVTNGLQDVALAFEPAEGGELKRPPRKPTAGLISRTLWQRIVYSGIWIGVATLLSFQWALDAGYGEQEARTFALTVLVAFNFFQVMNSRTEFRSLLTVNPFTNSLLLAAATGSLLLHLGAMTWGPSASVLGLEALSANQWGWAFVVGVSVLVVVELEKLLRLKFTSTPLSQDSESADNVSQKAT